LRTSQRSKKSFEASDSLCRGAISRTVGALESNPDAEWVLGFSGGKDSTALLKIFCAAISHARKLPEKINVIYCDTGVENPLLDKYVKALFDRLGQEAVANELPLRLHVLTAPVSQRFFVKIVGRGYPPPTNSFRWCTKSLRIQPVARFIAEAAKRNAIVSLGLRQSESAQRDRSLLQNGGGIWQDQVEGGRKYKLFLPILDLSVPDVWEVIYLFDRPRSIDVNELASLYRGASGECPMVKSPNAPPCATGRFGCWTCTVVRKDKSAQSLIDSGYSELQPFLEFRNWLSDIRNDPQRRWSVRRRGTRGLGPFTLEARAEILRAIRRLEVETGTCLVSREESEEIARLWLKDVPFSG